MASAEPWCQTAVSKAVHHDNKNVWGTESSHLPPPPWRPRVLYAEATEPSPQPTQALLRPPPQMHMHLALSPLDAAHAWWSR